jgi:hypothetical protein
MDVRTGHMSPKTSTGANGDESGSVLYEHVMQVADCRGMRWRQLLMSFDNEPPSKTTWSPTASRPPPNKRILCALLGRSDSLSVDVTGFFTARLLCHHGLTIENTVRHMLATRYIASKFVTPSSDPTTSTTSTTSFNLTIIYGDLSEKVFTGSDIVTW